MSELHNRECIDACNKLFRGELSAIETYNQAKEKFATPAERTVLEEILLDHSRNADVLRQHIISMGGSPSGGSGVWGGFAKAVEGTAKLLGKSPTLEVLRAGENHGKHEYQDALENKDVMNEIKELIAHDLLPVLDEHIEMLDRLAA